MLRITMSRSAAGAKKYYSEPYYNEGKDKQGDYYSGKDQAIGIWGGKGTVRPGLEGDIAKEPEDRQGNYSERDQAVAARERKDAAKPAPEDGIAKEVKGKQGDYYSGKDQAIGTWGGKDAAKPAPEDGTAKEAKGKQGDYYSGKDQAIGTWGGKGALRLGLEGDIAKEDFAAMCDNKNPGSGRKLTGRNDSDRTVGYDFTFNASKSVSLAYSFGSEADRTEILQAFRDSVSDTMREIETGMQARVRDKGRNENRETGNIAYGEFIHFTTRPVDGVSDPHLHAHCFVFNATHDDEAGKWKAGQFRLVKQDAPYYEAYFHSQLAAKLENIGYGVERTKNGIEISGIDKATLDKFSRRTKEIEEHARENNITDDRQKAQIGARTREAKRINVDAGQEFAEWKNRLTGAEFLQLRNLKKDSAGSGADSAASAREALEFSLKHHLERKSVASDKEILTTAIRESIGRTTPEQVKKEFHADRDIISVKEDNRVFITTRDALNEERQLIANAGTFKGKFRPINEDYRFKSDLLNEQQKKAIGHALSTTDGITIITGRAGTGKTTLMKEVQQGIHEAGKRIYPFAPSSEASRVVQRSEGFENADTLAALLKNKARHQEFRNQVIWIDEAGMVSNRDMNGVLAIAKEQNARVILSGDTRQHSSVERGDALRIMQKHVGINPVTVSRLQRQKEAEYRQAVKHFSEADIEKGFKKLEKIGAIKEVTGSSERVKAVAEDYYKSAYGGGRQSVLVIAPTHAEGDMVTSEIRNRLKQQKVIDGGEREFTVLKDRQYTQAEKARAENYRQSDILAFHQNIKGVRAGSKLEVMQAEGGSITARDSAGREHVIPVSASRNFNVFEARRILVAPGDRIRITGNGRAADGKHLFNGTSYGVEGFDRQGNIRLSNGSTLPKNYGQFTFGYVMTSHAAQGKTSDKVIISQSSAGFRAGSMEQFYVSVSRGKLAASIYTDDKAMLMQAVSRSSQRISATELLAKNERMKAAVEHGRMNIFEKMKDKARETIDRIKSPQIRNNELPGENRKGPAKSK